MIIKDLVYKIKNIKTIDKIMIDTLYNVSKKNMLYILLLSLFTTFSLYTELLHIIVGWCLLIIIILSIRLYSIYQYKHNYYKKSINQWYVEYLVSTYAIALCYSLLSVLFIPELIFNYQLFLIIVLLGLSSGAVTAISADFRLAIGYISILLLPLMSIIPTLDNSLHNILLIAIILYYLTQIEMIITNYKDTKNLKNLELEHETFHQLFNDAPVGIFSYNSELNIIDCNEKFNLLLENKREDILGLNLKYLSNLSPEEKLEKALSDGPQSYTGEYITTTGKYLWLDVKIFPYKLQYNHMMGGMAFVEDKTQEKSTQTELEYLAEHDMLTGLLNRRGLYNYVRELMSQDKHKNYYSILFYLDLNQFKCINDSLGHSVGDAVLLNVSERLKNFLGTKNHISRLGGDEFIVIMPYLAQSDETTKEKAAKYANNLQEIFEKPFIIKDLHLHIKASMGIIIIEPKYQNVEEILRHADITMYHAKNTNNSISYYNEALDTKQKELFTLQHDLAYAVDKNQFKIFLQPIVKMKNEKLYAAEALIRWEHPEKGLLLPNSFIPLSIEAGLLYKITWWVLDKICQYISNWKKSGLWNLDYISININAQQLIENNFAHEFLRRLKLHGLKTTDIVIEITERSLIDNFYNTQEVITILQKEGVRCAIDDFGVGYSSLSYLKKLSFNTLKIDRQFVENIEFNPKELLLVSSILEIGRQFNYNIVIEGIEDKKQKDLLLELDKELNYQGYYFSKPLHAEEFKKSFLY